MPNPISHNPTASSIIRVALVEDRPDIRDGLVQILNHADGFACIGHYGTMEAALAQLPLLPVQPQVVLIDLGLPGMSGLEGIRLLHERQPQLLLVVLTVFDDDARIFQALCVGAAGYLLKKTPPDRLLESLREAAHWPRMLQRSWKRQLTPRVKSVRRSRPSATVVERAKALSSRRWA